MDNTLSLAFLGGALFAVLQFPGEFDANASVRPIPSIQGLAAHFSLIDPEWSREKIEDSGTRWNHRSRHQPPDGKGSWMGVLAGA